LERNREAVAFPMPEATPVITMCWRGDLMKSTPNVFVCLTVHKYLASSRPYVLVNFLSNGKLFIFPDVDRETGQ